MGARDVLPDQARGAISWRDFNKFKMIYDSLCDGPFAMVQRGGDNAQGFTACSLSLRAVALRHANASCKTWRYGQPNEGEETFWPEPVVDLRNQGTGVLRALALVEKMGGSLDLRSESVSRLRLVNTLVSLFVLVPFAFWHMLALTRLALPHKPPESVVRSLLTLNNHHL